MGWRRAGLASGAVGAAALLSLAVPRLLDAGDVVPPSVALDLPQLLRPEIERLARPAVLRPVERIGFLGDSVSVHYPVGRRIPSRLQQALASRGRETRVAPVASGGMGPFDFYFLADEILDANPDRIVLALNPVVFSRSWSLRNARPELSGWIRPRRFAASLGLRLDWLGLTLDRVLLHAALFHARAVPVWRESDRLRARAVRGLLKLRVAAGEEVPDEFAGVELLEGSRPARLSAAGVRGEYGAALEGIGSDHPVLGALDAAVRAFSERGVAVTVFVLPVNVEHFDRVGAHDARGLRETLARVDSSVREARGRFVDLHDLLPDAAFRDASGHLTYGIMGSVDGPKRIAERLASLLDQE